MPHSFNKPLLSLAITTALLSPLTQAAPFTVTGVDSVAKTLTGTETGTVENGGNLSTTGGADAITVTGDDNQVTVNAGGQVTAGDGATGSGIGGDGGTAVNVTDSSNTLNNSGAIQGGEGGESGAYGTGGDGGVAVSGNDMTITNSGTIQGGDGGDGDLAGLGGFGGNAVSGSNMTVTNSGTIQGGAGGAGDDSGVVPSAGAAFVSTGGSTLTNVTLTTTSGQINGGDSLILNAVNADSLDVAGFSELTVKAGTSTINSLNQPSFASLQVNVTDDANYGKLAVTGAATLPSNAKIDVNVANPSFAFTTAALTDIITAGTLTSDGSFAVTDNSLLFNFDAIKDGNTVDLTLAAASPAVLSSTLNQGKPAARGAAAVIANDPSGALASNFVSLTTEQQVADAVESTLPGVSGGAAQLTNLANNAVTDAVASRQALNRGLSSGDGMMTDRHLWFKPFGGWTEQDDRQGVSGYDIDSYGLALGLDGDISSSWNLGFALAYINSDIDSNLASGSHNIEMDSYSSKLYATRMIDDVTALNLQFGLGLSDYDSNRRIFTGDVASADYDSWHAQLSAELERSYAISDKTVMTPYVHADYSYVKVDSYTETGAAALNLDVGDDSNDSLVLGGGVKADHTVSDTLLLIQTLYC